jgi:hypothetical protein
MKFYEQFSIGNRVEVDGLAGGLVGLGLGVSDGDRGTILKKQQGSWLDPVSRYTVEMDYPCNMESIEISGRHLRRASPELEELFEHKNLNVGAKVSRSIPAPSPCCSETSASSILQPDTNRQSNWIQLHGIVLSRRRGQRKNEPDSYLVEWEYGETNWCRETELTMPTWED